MKVPFGRNDRKLGEGGTPPPPGGRAGGVGARSKLTAASTDCALGSGEWAEPPQYLPALCWGVLKNPSKRGFYRHKAASQRLAIERLQCVQHASHSS